MKQIEPVVWTFYKDKQLILSQYNYDTRECRNVSGIENVSVLKEKVDSNFLVFPRIIGFKSASKGYENTLLIPEEFYPYLDYVRNKDKTCTATYYNSSEFTYHKALAFSSFYTNLYPDATVVSMGRGRDFENCYVGRFENSILVEEYKPTWTGFITSFLYWMGHSCTKSIGDNSEYYIEDILELGRNLEAPEDPEGRKKNFKSLLRNRPDFMQWKKNNYFRQTDPLEEKINTSPKRKKVFKNKKEEENKIKWAWQAACEYFLEFLNHPILDEMVKKSGVLIITGDVAEYPKLSDKVKYSKYRKFILDQNANVAHGINMMLYPGMNNTFSCHVHKKEALATIEDHDVTISDKESISRRWIREEYKAGKSFLYVRNNLESYYVKNDLSENPLENKGRIYRLTNSLSASNYASPRMIGNKVSLMLFNNREIEYDVKVLEYRDTDVFHRFLNVTEVLAQKINFNEFDELSEFAHKNVNYILLQGENHVRKV